MRTKICSLLALFLVLSAITGCTVETEKKKEESSSYYFYYVNMNETELEREIYEPKEVSTEYMMVDLMQRLNNKAMEGDNVNLLPADVTINSYRIEEAALTIDFSGSYADMSSAREVLVRLGTVKTFLQVPGIESVRFTLDGAEFLDFREQPVGAMTMSSFADFSEIGDTSSYCRGSFTLYFTDKTGTRLVEEKRTVRYRRDIPQEKVILEQLMKGPMEKDHYPTIPENAGIMNVFTADRICHVQFDEIFSDYALDISEKIPIYSVVNSLLASIDADRVQITVGNVEERNFRENMPLYHYYKKNDKLVLADTSKQ